MHGRLCWLPALICSGFCPGTCFTHGCLRNDRLGHSWLRHCRWLGHGWSDGAWHWRRPKYLNLAQLNTYKHMESMCSLLEHCFNTYPCSMPLVSASLLPSEPLAVVLQAVAEVSCHLSLASQLKACQSL